jgi:ubiquinone/menaquinone biosynthesis C-methylase UbiE
MKFTYLVAGTCLAGCLLYGQVATEANQTYQTSKGRMGVAATLANPERDNTQHPAELVKAMGVQPGMAVADVGTGVGYMLPYLSSAVGLQGKVVAEDIFDDFLAAARERTAKAQLTNVTFVKGTDKDPGLPAAALDRVLVLDAYHHFDYPGQMLAGIRNALNGRGKLVIVEYYKNNIAMNGRAMNHIRINKPEVIKEIEANGFHLASEREQIKDVQYMLVFDKK